MEKILIFIPMYNCGPQIPRTIEKIAALGEKQKLFSRVLIMDNGSRDDGLAAASEAIKTLDIPAMVVENHDNYGLGGSHKTAFNYALEQGYDYVAVLHGDDQGDIRDLVPLLEEGRHRRLDSLLGARFAKGSRPVNYSAFRIFGNHVFNIFMSLVSGRRVLDLGAGLNIYSCEYLKNRFYLYFPNDLSYNVFLLLYGIYSKSRFEFFPLTWREEDQVSNAKLFKQSRTMLKLAGQYIAAKDRLFSGTPNQWSEIDYGFDVIAENEAARLAGGVGNNEAPQTEPAQSSEGVTA
jgi:glycosyltransferase involved in cell wall biosynthesis